MQEVQAGRKVHSLPGSRDEPLPTPSSFLTGSTMLAATNSSSSHSLQLWRQNWQGATASVPRADTLRWFRSKARKHR